MDTILSAESCSLARAEKGGEKLGRLVRLTKQIRKEQQQKVIQTKNQVEIGKPHYFLDEFKDKRCTIKLLSGETLIGVLRANKFNKYDVLVEADDGKRLVFKHAIAYIELVEGVDDSA